MLEKNDNVSLYFLRTFRNSPNHVFSCYIIKFMAVKFSYIMENQLSFLKFLLKTLLQQEQQKMPKSLLTI